MASFNKVFSAVFLAVLYASTTGASPSKLQTRADTHGHVQVATRDTKLQPYHPPSTYKVFGEGVEDAAARGTVKTLPERATSVLKSRLGVEDSNIAFRGGYTDEEAGTFAYAKQSHNGIPFVNAVANMAWKDDKLVSFASSFVKYKSIASEKPTIPAKSVIHTVEKAFDGKYNNHPIVQEYLVKDDETVALVHVVQVQNEETNAWYEVYVDAHSGEILSVTNFVAEATYTVLPANKRYITEGVQVLTNPQDTISSPEGWHGTGTTTSGNNVVSYKSTTSNTAAQSSTGLNFNYNYDTSLAPSSTVNLNAARVNAFYIINHIHDYTYRYGFTETAYNFQRSNFGLGGSQNDPVNISVQDSSGTNNANFATPADGQSGTCRMYIWTYTSPNRDGSLENDIVIHEMTHGITNRMTGGGTGRCLQTTEAGGLGEGWSDTMADWNYQKSTTIVDYVLGDYVTNNAAGIRTKPYSTSTTVNNLTYASVSGLTSVHRIGEIWANTLHNVHAALLQQYGFDANAKTNPSSTAGNAVFLHLYLDALRLQPCNPTFVTARAAWIQADANRYGGANKCLLWKVFASKGLGSGAVSGSYVNNNAVPSGC